VDLFGCGGGVGGPHLELGGVGEYEVTGFEKGERGAFSINGVGPVGHPNECVGRVRVPYCEAESVLSDGVKACCECWFG